VSGWSLRRRFAVSVTVAGVVLIALSALVVVTFVRVGTIQRHITVTFYSSVRSSSDLLGAYLNEETGIRGYLLTREPTFLSPYTDGRRTETTADAELDGLLAHDPALVARLSTVRQAVTSWQQEYAEPVRALVAAGRGDAIDTQQQATGKRLFDQVRSSYDGYEQALVSARAAAVNDLNRGRTLLVAAFTVLAVFVLIAAIGLGTALRRWILIPLDAVREDARAVAGGDVEHRVRPLGPPELHQLGADVEQMREHLLAAYAAAVQATATVEQQRAVLERQTEDLRRSNAELEQFAYVASHDLQEPLRKVASFTELLQRRYAGRLDDRADSYIGYAADGARRMQGLINDLLAFSRVGRIGVTRRPVPLGEAVHTALDNLKTAIDDAGARIEYPAQLPTVTGDPGLLTQVFQNLIGNAVKFARPGVPPAVCLTCTRDQDGEQWRIDVRDDGIGIDPEYADRVFVIFSRLNRREDYPGSGIGLALAKKIVEYHQGRIWLGEHDGPGTTISFTLPVDPSVREDSAAGLDPVTADDAALRKETA
jgi:signal transduction histidine kinase